MEGVNILAPSDAKSFVLQLCLRLNEIENNRQLIMMMQSFIIIYHRYLPARSLLRHVCDLPPVHGTFTFLCLWLSLRIHDFFVAKKELLNRLLAKTKSWPSGLANRIKLALISSRVKVIVKRIPLNLAPIKSILQMTPDELADYFFLIDYQLFQRIRPGDYLNKNSPRIRDVIDRANAVTAWAASYILAQKEKKIQEKMARKFIAVAFLCSRQGNFAATEALIRTFSLHEVSRIRSEWKLGDQKLLWQDLSVMMSPTKNYVNYQEELHTRLTLGLPIIPYLGVILKTFAQLDEANADKVDKKVNIKKLELISSQLEKINEFNKTHRKVKMVPVPRNLVKLSFWSNEKLEEASYAIKPVGGSSINEESSTNLSGSDLSDITGAVDID